MVKHTPSNNRLILRADNDFDIEGLREILRAFDTKIEVEALPSEDRAYVLHVKAKAKDPKTLWQKILEKVETPCLLTPVLNDDNGEPHYPTGTLTARFSRALSDEELQSFAEERELTVDSRNAWVPRQVVFRPRHPERSYLPELAAKLENEAEVTAAWEDTESFYFRGR